MVTTVTLRRTHNVVFPHPRTCGRVAHCITQSLRTAGSGISQIVMTVTLIEPRSLLIVLQSPISFLRPGYAKVCFGSLFLDRAHHTILRINHKDIALCRNHILIELDAIDMWVTPVHISLPIIIDEDWGVDIIPMFLLPHKGFTQWITERTVRRISYQHTNTMTMQRSIEIILAVMLYRLNSPRTVITTAPFELLQRSYSTMLCPVHHISCRPQKPVIHEEASCVSLVLIGDILRWGIMRCKQE